MNEEVSRPLVRLVVALFAGLLIGLDRERAEARKGHEIFGGIRTFPIIALAGCVPMLLVERLGPWIVIVAFAAVAGVTLIAYWRSTGEGHIGATTEASGIATFLVGVLAGAGELLVAGAVGIAVATLLVFKPRLEGISRKMSTEEMTAVIELAVISGIVLPILPNRGYGPWESLNPRDIWLVVVLVAGLSFAGFVAMRLLGEQRGLTITGAVGGLVSSTAVTVAMADRTKEQESAGAPAAAATLLASSVMALRMLVLVAIINNAGLPRVVPVFVAMAVAGAIGARIIVHADHHKVVSAGERIRNPFSLRHALVFAAIYAVMSLAVRATQEYFGSGAMFVTAAVGSVADVDAVTIALSRLASSEQAWRGIAAAIAFAGVVNTLVKLVIAVSRGRGHFRRYVGLGLGGMAAVGIAAGSMVYAAG